MCLFHVYVYVFYDFTFVVFYNYFLCAKMCACHVYFLLSLLTYLLISGTSMMIRYK